MKSMRIQSAVFLSTLVLVASFTGVSWGATLSGKITNSTSKSGRLYVMLFNQDGNESSGYGTSIADVAANATDIQYTIKGVRQGTFSQVRAFLDTRGTGYPYSGSPIGSTSSGSQINVSTSDLSGLDFSIQDQGTQTLTAPPNLNAGPMDGGVIVVWDTPKNTNNIEIADKYNVYWGTNSNVGPGNTVGGDSRLNIPSRDDGHFFIPLTNGTSYYFAVEAVLGGSTAISRTATSTTINPPIGGHSVTAHINFNSIPSATPLLAVLSSNNGPPLARLIASPAQSQTITITGVPDGIYHLFIIHDKNNNGYYDTGDVDYSDKEDMSTFVSVQGANVDLIPLKMATSRNLETIITTETQLSGTIYYQVNFNFHGQEKKPAHIVLNSGPQMTETSLGPDSWGSLYLRTSVPSIPKIGDSYNFTVTYTDGTTEPLTLTVSNVLNKSANQTYPTGDTAPSSTTPRFAWNTLSGAPNAAYMYHLTLQQANSYDGYLWEKYLTSDQLSVQYDGSPLSAGTTYNWGIQMIDKYGNSSSSWQQFTPQASGPSIISLDTTTLPCGSGTPIVINGTGFNNIPANNSVYFNNSYAVTPVTASSTQLTVNLPACSTAPSTGPIIVSTNGQTVASAVEFTPTFTYNYYVKDFSSPSVVLSGVQVEVAGKPTITPVTSNASGLFSLPGIPTGIPYRLKLSKANYMPVYTAFYANYSNTSVPADSSYNFALAQQSDFDSWGITSGKGVLRARTRDASVASSTNYLSGVTVTAYSNNHDSASYYTVAYTNPANANALVSGPGTSTHTDGKYYVLNVDDGDIITVGSSKTGYTFAPRVFIGQADAMGQSSIYGTPVVSVSGISPSLAATGSNITINGNNFSTALNQSSVCFQYNMGGTSCVNPISASATQLTVTVPCGNVSGPITITSNGQQVDGGTFTVATPIITGFSPVNGPAGSPITITGSGFSSGNCNWESNVSFAGTPNQQITSISPTQIVINTPYLPNTMTGAISVTTQTATATSSSNYTAYPLPNFSGITPTKAVTGESVTINGSFYDFNIGNYLVMVGGVTGTVTSVNAGTMVFTVPPNAGSGGQVVVTYYGGALYGPSLTVVYRLNATIAGSGNINSTNGLGELACSTSSCTGNFNYNESASLAATPSTGYNFTGWSGDCTGTGNCSMNMTTSKSVTATFVLQSNVRIGTTYFPTVQSAIDAAVNGDIIKARDMDFAENITVDQNGRNIILKGGYQLGFSTQTGVTSFSKLTLSRGTLTIDKLTVK